MKRGFTLIELLIVVAIIAILAAIAVPNFLEAQTRARVSRVKSDMRSVATALEAYAVDYNRYPSDRYGGANFIEVVFELTTPVSYLTTVEIRDPFIDKVRRNGPNVTLPPNLKGSVRYLTYDGPWQRQTHPNFKRRCWSLNSFGPDYQANYAEHIPYILFDPNFLPLTGSAPYFVGPIRAAEDMVYDATNGTLSAGDLPRFGGEDQGASRYN